jgi:hypothetical protein
MHERKRKTHGPDNQSNFTRRDFIKRNSARILSNLLTQEVVYV